MRKRCKKFQPNIISYKSYDNFSNLCIRETLINKSSNENLLNNDIDFQRFRNLSLENLNKHVPCRTEQSCGDQLFL